MKPLKNLGYRLKRIFQGESGIVERVIIARGEEDIIRRDMSIYPHDDIYRSPQKVFYRNPLGEIRISLTPTTMVRTIDNFTSKPNYIRVYKTYKPGDKFP